jgi:PAS domain S-box-containing protein
MIALSADLNILLREEELVHRFVQALGDLLPGRLLSVRLVEPTTLDLSLVYATGRLEPTRRDRVSISRAALEAAAIDARPLAARGLGVDDAYERILVGAVAGFDLPLHQAGHFFGIVNVEYSQPAALPNGDQEVAVALSQLLASSLRNAQVLRESQYLRDYLEKLLDNANATILVTGTDRRIQVVNRALERLLGRARDNMVGMDLLDLLPELERPRVLDVWNAALRRESSTSVEVRLTRSDGGHARVALNTAAILSPDQDVEGVVLVGQDLTELKALQEKIIQTEKLATIGQFAAGIVHELNNPLTSISVYSDYLIKKYDREKGEPADREKLRRILQGAERILHFTRDLMSYARPSNEAPSRVDLHAVLDQAIVFCEPMLEEQGTRVVREYAPNLPKVKAVESQLHQVLINLITNACHAMTNGPGRLELTTSTGPSSEVVLEIRDNGCGIPEADLAAIFEPFFTTKEAGLGTGLGLSIVRNIIRNHDGRIDVTSAVGGGTTFRVVLGGKRSPSGGPTPAPEPGPRQSRSTR